MASLQSNGVRLEQVMPLMEEMLASGRSVSFSPRGTSMLPMLRQGVDTVKLSPAPAKLRKFDLPFYQRDDGQYVLHRIISTGDTYTCMGDNQFLPEPGVRRDQIIAVVTSFSRGSREISVQSPGYHLYCRFWHYSRPVRHFYRRVKNCLRRLLK